MLPFWYVRCSWLRIHPRLAFRRLTEAVLERLRRDGHGHLDDNDSKKKMKEKKVTGYS
jgi:hypothetical protein